MLRMGRKSLTGITSRTFSSFMGTNGGISSYTLRQKNAGYFSNGADKITHHKTIGAVRNMSLDIRQLEELKDLFPLLAYQRINDELILVVSSDKIFLSLSFLKHHIGYRYQMLSCVSGVDFLGEVYRFSVVYDLLSLTYNSRMRIKTFVNEITPVASAVNVFINANWWEREIWDLYGIYFDNHPDLRRILTDYGFEGHPMRKDFPLSGYVELRYDDSKKRVVVEPLELTQEFRTFSFETPW